jgi:fimbrial chaperone protein
MSVRRSRMLLLPDAGPARLLQSCLLLALVLVLTARVASAQIGVSPPWAEVDMVDGRASGAFTVLNLGPHPVAIEVGTTNFDLDADGRVVTVPPTEQSLDQWLVLNPLRFHIAPGGYQKVRYAVRPRVEPTPGEHRAMIYFAEVDDPAIDRPRPIVVLHRIGAALYAQAPEATREGTLLGTSLSADALRFTIRNDGNAHVRLRGTVALTGPSIDDPLELPLPGRPVLPATTREIVLPLDRSLPAGDYLITLDGELGNTRLRETTTLTAP